MIRTSVASLLGVVLLFVGVIAISESAQQSESTAMNGSAASSDAFNMSTQVFDGVSKGGGEAIVWFGVAAVILVSLGLLAYAGQGGGR